MYTSLKPKKKKLKLQCVVLFIDARDVSGIGNLADEAAFCLFLVFSLCLCLPLCLLHGCLAVQHQIFFLIGKLIFFAFCFDSFDLSMLCGHCYPPGCQKPFSKEKILDNFAKNLNSLFSFLKCFKLYFYFEIFYFLKVVYKNDKLGVELISSNQTNT